MPRMPTNAAGTDCASGPRSVTGSLRPPGIPAGPSPASRANPAEEGITVIHHLGRKDLRSRSSLKGRRFAHSPRRGFLSALTSACPTPLLALQMSFSCSGKGLEPQDCGGVGSWEKCSENQPFTSPTCDFGVTWREGKCKACYKNNSSRAAPVFLSRVVDGVSDLW